MCLFVLTELYCCIEDTTTVQDNIKAEKRLKKPEHMKLEAHDDMLESFM